MDGLAVGRECFRDHAEAAASFCSTVSGVSAGGVVSCSAPLISGSTVSYALAVDGGASTATRTATAVLQPCDPQDIEYYAPVLASWFLALVLVLCLRMVYTRTFPKGE